MRCQPYQILDHNYLVVVATQKETEKPSSTRCRCLFNHKRNLWIRSRREKKEIYNLILFVDHLSSLLSRFICIIPDYYAPPNESKRVTDFHWLLCKCLLLAFVAFSGSNESSGERSKKGPAATEIKKEQKRPNYKLIKVFPRIIMIAEKHPRIALVSKAHQYFSLHMESRDKIFKFGNSSPPSPLFISTFWQH